jgi:hypothetical protein
MIGGYKDKDISCAWALLKGKKTSIARLRLSIVNFKIVFCFIFLY